MIGGAPAYAVKGVWEGAPGTLKSVAKGNLDPLFKDLEPHVGTPELLYGRGGLSLSVEDGRLGVDYTTKLDDDMALNFHVDASKAWRTSLTSGDTSLRVHGKGPTLDDIFWEGSRASIVEGIGEMKIEFNSNKAYNLTVAHMRLLELAALTVDARVRASNHGVVAHVDARSKLPNNVDLSYSVENQEGVYVSVCAKHVACVGVPLAGGYASLRSEFEPDLERYTGSYTRDIQGGKADFSASLDWQRGLGYNISYARGLTDLLPIDANIHLGVDEAGAYSKFLVRHDLGSGLDAAYEVVARLGSGQHKDQLAHALKVANKYGYAQLTQGIGFEPRLRIGYEFNA